MFDVACVGILVADCICQGVKGYPEKGKLDLIDNLRLFSGGCALNAAIDLAKLGASAAQIGMVGNDGFGTFLKSELTRNNVNADGLVLSNEHSTSASVVLVDTSGERSFLHFTGANAAFTDSDVNFDVIKNSKIVFVAGTMLMPSFDGEPCARVLKKSREMGKITVLDSAWDDTGRWMEVIEPCLKYVDYFIPSYDEAKEFAGKDDVFDIAEVFFAKGVSHVAIKLGKDGCYVQDKQGEKGIIIPTYLGVKPVDTTGAGDSFCSGFVYGLSHGMDIFESAKLGNAVGTHCIMATGASTGIVPYEKIKEFMEANE